MPSYENCYNGNPNVKRDGVEWKYTEEELKEYIKCSKNPAYFIRKYVKIVHLDKGLVEFNLRGYQEKMVNHINDNRFSIILSGRQSGKSVTSAAWILWYVLFHESKTVAVLANKGAIAREILFRITSMLEGVPFFLQPGCKELNKGSIVFSNGSKVIAAATSSSSIRGLSCVTANTKVTVKYEDGHIESDTIDKLLDKSPVEILTHYGFKKFDGFKETNRVNRLIKIKTKTRTIECTENHKLLDSDFLFRRADSLRIGDILVTENHNEEIESITKIFGFEIPVYDAINVEDVHSYYTNGLVSHNCSVIFLDEFAFVNDAATFYTSTFPTISSGETTKVIVTSTPNGVGNMFYKLWEGAIQGRSEYKPMKINWWDVPGRDEEWKQKMIANTSELQFCQEYECVTGDTLITIKDKLTDEIKTLSIYDFIKLCTQ